MANGDQITEDQVFVCTAVRIDIRKDGIKGDGIAVDVGEDGDAHGQTTRAGGWRYARQVCMYALDAEPVRRQDWESRGRGQPHEARVDYV